MNDWQKLIKYGAVALAVLIIIDIFSVIFMAIGVVSLFDKPNKELKVAEEIQNVMSIKNLDIDLKAGNLVIEEGDKFEVKTDNSNIKIKTNDDTIFIKESKWTLAQLKNSKVVITLTKEDIFNKVDISSGAGSIEINYLQTDYLDFDLGAGSLTADDLLVNKEADIEGGAGKIEIKNSNFNNLDLDLGVGKTSLSTILNGKTNIDMSVGKLDIKLLDGKENYTIKAKKGLGNINVFGTEIGNNDTYGNGSSLIDIKGAVGSININ